MLKSTVRSSVHLHYALLTCIAGRSVSTGRYCSSLAVHQLLHRDLPRRYHSRPGFHLPAVNADRLYVLATRLWWTPGDHPVGVSVHRGGAGSGPPRWWNVQPPARLTLS